MRSIAVAFAAAGLFVTGAAAQHEEHHKDQAPAQKQQSNAANSCGPMMSQMPSVMRGQTDTAKLVDELQKSLAAIEAEKDPAAVRTQLAEHGALLKQLQAKVQSQSHMMDMMQHVMSGSMMGGQTKGAETEK